METERSGVRPEVVVPPEWTDTSREGSEELLDEVDIFLSKEQESLWLSGLLRESLSKKNWLLEDPEEVLAMLSFLR